MNTKKGEPKKRKKRKLEAKQKAEAQKLLIESLDKKIKEAYEKQFSDDDRHPYAERIIAATLKDPHSYRFIQSEASLVYLSRKRFVERKVIGGFHRSVNHSHSIPAVKVLVKYSATNSYGGRIADIKELHFCINGNYIDLESYSMNMEILEQTEKALEVTRGEIDWYITQKTGKDGAFDFEF